jgi:hypothetical protein
MARSGELSGEALRPIVKRESWVPPLDDLAAEAVAEGGSKADALVMEAFRQRGDGWRLLALALARTPSAAVTEELAELANSKENRSAHRMSYSLVLAARGDGSRDWLAEVVRGLRRPVDAGEALDREWFLHALFYAARRLTPSPALLDRLWQMVADDSGETGIGALATYAILSPELPDPAKSQTLRRFLTDIRPAGPPEAQALAEAVTCLALARMGLDPEANAEKALGAIGSVGAMATHDGWEASVMMADTLVNDALALQVGRGLSASSASVRLGAVRIALAMGPDACQMLPDLERLLSDADLRVAEEARRVRVLVAGLDKEGHWVFNDEAKGLGWRSDVVQDAPGATPANRAGGE